MWLKPMTHLKVWKFLAEVTCTKKFRKKTCAVLHDTLACWTTKVAG